MLMNQIFNRLVVFKFLNMGLEHRLSVNLVNLVEIWGLET